MDWGVYYIAVNRSGIYPLQESIRSLRQSNPGVRIAVATDFSPLVLRYLADSIETVIPVVRHLLPDRPDYPDHGFFSKVKHMYSSPFEYTLFLDYDTHVLGKVDELFALLEQGHFDMAMAHDVGQSSSSPFGEIPLAYRMFNTGVLAYRKCGAVHQVMDAWWKNMEALDNAWGDQPCFMKAVYECAALRYATLPCEWNFRFIFPQAPFGTVAILHGRPSGDCTLEKVASNINKVTETNRFWFKDKCYGHFDLTTGELA